MAEETGNEQVANGQDRQVAIQRIYLKDASFEAPNTPEAFVDEWKPHVNMNINNNTKKLDDDSYEVILTLTVEVKNNDNSAFLCEVQQAGVFTMKGLAEEEIRHVSGTFCPNQLYPYARAAISDMIVKGGFPHLTLQPLNFDLLLAQHQQQVQDAQTGAEASEERH